MNNKIEDALWADYDRISDLIKVTDDTDERKPKLFEELGKIRSDLLRFELSKNEVTIKREEIKAEDEREKVRNKITLITFGVSTSLSLYAIIRTFRFDMESTVTSTLGRSILNSVVPKVFKR